MHPIVITVSLGVAALILAAMRHAFAPMREYANVNPWEGFVWPQVEYREPADPADTQARIAASARAAVIHDPAPLPVNPYRMSLDELRDSARYVIPVTELYTGHHRALAA